MRTSNEPVKAMDTADDQELSVSVARNHFGPGRLVVLADTTQIPYHRIALTPAEARQLAAYLTEQAIEAETADV